MDVIMVRHAAVGRLLLLLCVIGWVQAGVASSIAAPQPSAEHVPTATADTEPLPTWAEPHTARGQLTLVERGAERGEPTLVETDAERGEPSLAEPHTARGQPTLVERGAERGEPSLNETDAAGGGPTLAETDATGGEMTLVERSAERGERTLIERDTARGELTLVDRSAERGERTLVERGAAMGEPSLNETDAAGGEPSPTAPLTTSERQEQCTEQAAAERDWCNTTWDGVVCWPATAAGARRVLPCFAEFNGILYSQTNLISRLCLEEGVWSPRANYSACRPAAQSDCTRQPHVQIAEVQSIIYLIGYSTSLVSLAAATFVFRWFSELSCHRNTIHTNLFVTCMVTNTLWIVTLTVKLLVVGSTPVSCLMLVMLHYFHVATFFWMFAEGHYLYMLVVQTFGVDLIRSYVYPIIGWGVPFLIMTSWGLVRWMMASPGAHSTHLQADPCRVSQRMESVARGAQHGREPPWYPQCPWLEASNWDWIYMGPSLAVLGFNAIFLARIMWVLITKLRSTNSAETQQYKKATKALLVLLPLLGLTYFLVIATPAGGVMQHVIAYITAVLISTQGLTVSMLYCFCNGEVQATLRSNYLRYRAKALLQTSSSSSRLRKDISLRYMRPPNGASATEVTFAPVSEQATV